jgi:hypothetical protein
MWNLKECGTRKPLKVGEFISDVQVRIKLVKNMKQENKE